MNAALVRSPISPRQSFQIFSYAKLNLFLDVLGKRADGYHELETLFERISLCDTIVLTELASDEIVVSCSRRDLPTDERNLAFKAARLLKDSLKISNGVKIDIIKNIPVGAGLAGGSSNAASVLVGLNKLFRLGLNKKTLAAYANRLGSDVAFFILDTPFAIGKGRGEKLKAIPLPKNSFLWHVLCIPFAPVLTKDVFRLLDESYKEGQNSKNTRCKPLKSQKKGFFSMPDLSKNTPTNMLTKKGDDVKILLSYLRKRDADSLNRNIYNRLSETVMKSYRFVSVLKSDLLKSGLKYVHMSGSGPTLFATFKSKKEAEKSYHFLKGRFSNRCSVFLTSTR